MALDPSMQQVVEVALNILPTTPLTPDEILDQITDYVWAKRNIALDRVAFEKCHQSNTESFEDFYIRLRRLADAADLCATCVDARVATRIMAGIRDTETKRKLLVLTPFPSAQQAINMCRSEEAARMNERSLSNQSSINHVRPHQRIDATAASCGSCGRNNHRPGEACPATGKMCHNCGGSNHFSPRCPKPRRSSSTGQSGGGIGKSEGAQPGSESSSMGAGTYRFSPRLRRQRPVPFNHRQGHTGWRSGNICRGLDILKAIGMTEKDLDTSSFDLVMADKTTPLLVIGQITIVTEYEGITTTLTIVISPEISGLLISWYDCISLGILHADYPKPVRHAHINSTPVKESHQEAAPPSSIPESISGDPTEEQKNRMEQAFIEDFSDV
jgi:hypothetical protein